MKKIILFTFLVYISFYNYTYAAGVCPIKDKSAQVLLDYLNNNRIVIKNVTNGIIKGKKEKNKKNENIKNETLTEKQINGIKKSIKNTMDDFNKSANETASIFNQMFNFTGYFSYFKYFVSFQIFNEIPHQIKRDYNLLSNENKGLLEYIKKIDRDLSADIVIDNACKGVEVKCDLDGEKTAKQIIGELIHNNDKILNLYRTIVIGEDINYTINDLILVDKSFIGEIQKNYGKKSLIACSNEKGGFAEQIGNSIKNIELVNEKGQDGIKKWSDTWQLLIGNKPNEEDKIARSKLKEYLSNAGISTQNQEIALNNLNKYSQEGFSLNNNFLTNTFNSIVTKIEKQAEFWGKKYLGEYLETKEDKKQKNVDLNFFKKMEDIADINNKIRNDINKLYNEELPFTAIGDTTTEKLRAKIIDTHFSLDNSIQILEKTIIKSQSFCKSTDKESGKCN